MITSADLQLSRSAMVASLRDMYGVLVHCPGDPGYERVGYDPLRIDPVDGQAYLAAAKAALSPEEFQVAVAEGHQMELADARDLLEQLVSPRRTSSVLREHLPLAPMSLS